MRQIHKDRLLKLADFLANDVPKKHFDLNWFTRDLDVQDDELFKGRDEDEDAVLIKKLNKIKKDLKPHTCGAVACAVGWMPAIFPRTFTWNEDAEVILRKDINDYPETNFDAVNEFLGLNWLQLAQLFTTDYYPKGRRGPKSVANKIKKFVTSGFLSTQKYENEDD